MRVIHLPYGIGICVLSQALRKHGIDAVSCSLKHNRYAYLADLQKGFDQLPAGKETAQRKAFFAEAINTYDIFHFHFGETFFPDRRDVPLLAREGKKMVVHHRGSEARILSKARSFRNRYAMTKRTWSEAQITANLKYLSSYIDHAIVPDHELLPYVEPYYKYVHVVPHVIDHSRFIPKFPSADDPLPLIVHAPSHREVKGTPYVLSAIRKLKKTGIPFQFQLIERMNHAEAMNWIQKSAIVIDQLRIGSYANLSMEAMAMGKPVICYLREDLNDKFPGSCPIVNANPDSLFDVLLDLLRHPHRWEQLGRDGLDYVRQHHGMDQAARSLVNIYEQL